MPDITDVAGKVAGIVAFIAFVPYILATLRRKMTPNRATWWIWTVVGFMLGASYYSSGADHTIWVPVSYFIGPLAVSIIAIRYGEGGWTWFDRGCLFVSGVGVVLWWIFNSPLSALLINLSIDFVGGLPTARKVYYKPRSESSVAWTLTFTANAINMFAIERWVFAIAVYPIYMVIGSGLITTLIFVRRKFQ